MRNRNYKEKCSFSRNVLNLVVVLALLLITAGSAVAQQKTIQVALNENPFGPAKGVKEAIAKETVNIARYTGKEGEELVAALAKHEGVAPEQIITGEILDLLGVYLGLKGGVGSEFIYTVPGYPALVNAAARVGGVVISVPLNDKLENDLPAISAQINAKTQAIFLVNPHNPSGTVTDNHTFHDFLTAASKKTLVIVDEAYLEFSDNFAERTAVLNTKKGENVLVFRTFAKAYGLGGLALGYAIAPKELADYLKKQGLGGVHDLNRLSIAAVLASLKDVNYISGVQKSVAAERDKWNKYLDQRGLKHTTSQANFVYFDTKRANTEVAKKLKDEGIIIGRGFAPYDTWIRITIGLPAENIRIQQVLDKILK